MSLLNLFRNFSVSGIYSDPGTAEYTVHLCSCFQGKCSGRVAENPLGEDEPLPRSEHFM